MTATKMGLDPIFAKKLSIFEKTLAEHGIKVIMTWGYRSIEAQNRLYAKGRTALGSIVTNAKGGYSWHNFGRAADYAFIIDGKVTWNGPWDEFGRIAKQCGLEWGGAWKRFKDRPHVQYTSGKTLEQMRTAKNAK
ncbi:MAG: M15 family metallopeptidase [Armatimonadota bacterium]